MVKKCNGIFIFEVKINNMPQIIWKGFTKPDFVFQPEPLPRNSIRINIPDNNMQKSFLFAIPFIIIVLLVLHLKELVYKEFPIDRPYAALGMGLGILFCVVHEFLHAIVYPRNYKAYIGIIPKKIMFYMSCSAPLKRGRFVLMSLMPMILGIIPLLLFIMSPLEHKVLNAILWPMAMIGLVSPCPDYLNVYYVLKEAASGSYVQDGEDGLYWFAKF